MRLRVDVTLKEGVLDPQGKAIGHALSTLGFQEVGDVRVGKAITLDLATDNREEAMAEARQMAEKLLANTVIEDYRVSLVET